VSAIDETIAYLSFPERRMTGIESAHSLRESLAAEKRRSVEAGNGAAANRLWCLEQALHVQDLYIQSFEELRSEEFPTAWRTLERVETAVAFLERHEREHWQTFRLDFIQLHVRRWQSLYPYKFFLSPEFLYKRKSCTICNAPVSIRNPCGHRIGELYDGELCARRIDDLAILGMALVTSPVQKYSIIHPAGMEYNYAAPQYVIRRLQSPFHAWEPTFGQRRHPHSRYAHVGRNDPCPCGKKAKYKKCCLRESGVLRPHISVWFEVPPPAEALALEYSEPGPRAA